MNFVPEMIPSSQDTGPAFWFIFYHDKLLVKLNNDSAIIPFTGDLSTILNSEPLTKHFLGKLNNHSCYTLEIPSDNFAPEYMTFLGLRRLFGLIEENLFWVAGRAIQIINWDRTHQFCGRCGRQTYSNQNEYAKVCPECGFTSYPRISPAIIVAVTKENKILLARNSRFKKIFYSVLSGFVEPGETLEECLRREVEEEVGIEVKNISYFGSQSWPFPNSLMVAFTAEYDRGEIIIDNEEIIEAKWFTVNDLPDLPNSISIARQLINWFIKKYS